MARQVLPLVGAIVGAYFGNPQLGWAIGSAIGNAVDPATVKGPSIGDIANQTSQEGGPRPIVYGLSQPIAGNIIVSGPPRKVKNKSGGKGGPEVETESVYRTYAIGVCEGDHTFVRVWKNAQLVYDISSTSQLSDADNAKFLEKARFFTGTFTQDPSPDLEAIFGIGTTPAHRGTAYMVMADDDLTDMRGAIPQFTFQMGDAEAPSFGPTLLELHFDESDSSTTFVDSSEYQHPITRNGSPVNSHDRFVCGVGSGRVPSASSLSVSDDLFNPGDSDFTIEAWLYIAAPSVYGVALARKLAFTTLYPLDWIMGDNGSMSAVGAVGDGQIWPAGTTAYSIGVSTTEGTDAGAVENQWFHVAFERFGAIFTCYINGVPFADEGNPAAVPPIVPGTYTGPLASNSEPLTFLATIGAFGVGEYAYADDYVWTQSAKYQGNAFTPTPCSAQTTLSLADVVEDICARANLDSGKIDTTELEADEVIGFTVINTYPAYAALQALSDVYLFDPSSYDGAVHYVKRGANYVSTVSDEDLLDADDNEQAKRADPIAIPRILHLNYYDVAGGLSTDKQTSERSGDRRSQGESGLQSAVLMDADRAAQVVAINHKVMIENSRGELEFSLSDRFIGLTPAAVVVIEWEGVNRRVRLTQLDVRDGFQDYKALFDRQSAYTSNVQGIPSAPQTAPPSSVVGPTLIAVLDIPILIDADDNLGLIYYVAISGVLDAWTGAQVELSMDGGANYVRSSSGTVATTMGELIAPLEDHPEDIPDVTHTLQVRIDTPLGDLEETNLAGMLNGLNLAAIGNEADGYELIQFAGADEVTEGNWDLTTLLRGRKGTGSRSHTAGEKFVLLTRGTLAAVPASLVDIGRAMTFRATSYGTSTDTGTVVSMTYQGISQTEREPAYVEAHRDGADMVVSWQGVGRLGAGAAAAQGLRFIGYRVTYSDGVTTIEAETTAQEHTQNVSTLAISPITVSVAQINSLTGDGPEADVEVV